MYSSRKSSAPSVELWVSCTRRAHQRGAAAQAAETCRAARRAGGVAAERGCADAARERAPASARTAQIVEVTPQRVARWPPLADPAERARPNGARAGVRGDN